jgi:starch phosphorylase
MEVGLTTTIPTYSGGLGVLAGDMLKTLADMEVPAIGVTLLNEKGYFQQHIDNEGNQHEDPVDWQPHDHLVLLPNVITVTIANRAVKVKVWKHLLTGTTGGNVPLYFLDTNVEGNTPADRELTSFLYGGDKAYRLSQEIILGIGGMKMLSSLGYHDIRKYHLNEGHAALLTAELLRRTESSKNDRKAIETVRQQCVFTTHTPVAAGHDRFERSLFKELLGDYVPEEILKESIDDEGKVNMTLLALALSAHVNGVAKRHGEVTRGMFPNHHIDAITNGVHVPTWTSDEMKNLFDKHIPGWRTDPYSLRYALSIPSEEVWKAHEESKRKLVERINRETGAGFDHQRFTIGFARRFTAYKRPDLILLDLERLIKVAEKVGDIQVVFAGKAHKNDTQGKEIIRRVVQACKAVNARNCRLRMVFLEHYDMDLSRMMVSGCDIWLNNPQRPYEASGTSGMKAAVNGVPHMSSLDGWWIEGHIEGVTGWKLGPSPKEAGFYNDYAPDDEAEDLYRKLEEIVPLHYANRPEWVRIMKHCIAINGSFFNTYRMVQQYLSSAYLE